MIKLTVDKNSTMASITRRLNALFPGEDVALIFDDKPTKRHFVYMGSGNHPEGHPFMYIKSDEVCSRN